MPLQTPEAQMRQTPGRVMFLVALFSGFWPSSPAAADTITFDNVSDGFYTAVTVNGVVFRRPEGTVNVISGENNCIQCAANGSHYLTAWGGPTTGVLMTTASGNPFSLFGFDAAESFAALPDDWAREILVIGQLVSGGEIRTSFTLDRILDGIGGLDDFQRFVLPGGFTNLTSVMFLGSGNTTPDLTGMVVQDFALDNIVNDLPAPVPEPGTMVLVFSGLVAGLRQRHASRARHCRPAVTM
jgi:hypothetical protein